MSAGNGIRAYEAPSVSALARHQQHLSRQEACKMLAAHNKSWHLLERPVCMWRSRALLGLAGLRIAEIGRGPLSCSALAGAARAGRAGAIHTGAQRHREHRRGDRRPGARRALFSIKTRIDPDATRGSRAPFVK